MKYFTELLESYSKLKKRTLKLLEASKVQLDPNAKAAADQFIGQAKSKKITIDNPVTVIHPQTKQQIGVIYSSVDKKKNPTVVFDGFPSPFGKRARAVEGTAQSGQNYNDFVALLSSKESIQKDTAPGGEVSKNSADVQPTETVPFQPKYSWIDGNAFIDQASYERAIERVCSKSKKECNELKNAYSVFLNSGETGGVAYTISRTRYMVQGCTETNDPICKPTSNPNDDISSKQAAAQTLQKGLKLLTKEGPLTDSEKTFLERNINLSQSNQIFLIDRSSGKGLMITQGRRTELYRVLKQLSETKGAKLLSDKKNFMIDAVAGGGGAGSTIRGFYYESLRKAAIELNNCSKISQDQVAACERKAAESFERWRDQPDLLREAFSSLLEQFKTDGEIAIDVENKIDMFLMNTIIGHVGAGDFTQAEQSFRIFANRMARLSQLGVIQRNPSDVISTATDVGEGKKADLKEFYPSIDEARKALAEMNLSEFEDMLKVEPDGRVSLGDSLKFSTSFQQVDAGQMSTENMLAALSKPVGDPQHKLFQDMGITPNHKKFISKELKEVQRIADMFSKIPNISEYLDSEGNLKKNASREKLLIVLKKNLQKESFYKDLPSDLIRKIDDSLEAQISTSKGMKQDWSEFSMEISKTLQKQRINNMIQSKDANEREMAASFIAGLGVMAGGSADNAMLTVVDASKQKMHITNQNSSLKGLSTLISEVKSESFDPDLIQTTNNFFKIRSKNPDGTAKKTGFDYQIHFDGNTSDCHIHTSVIENQTREGANTGKTFKVKDISRVGMGMEPPRRSDASHRIAKIGITLAEAIKKYSETLKLITD